MITGGPERPGKERPKCAAPSALTPSPYLPLTSSSQEPEARGAQRDLQGFSWAQADRVRVGGAWAWRMAGAGGVAEAGEGHARMEPAGVEWPKLLRGNILFQRLQEGPVLLVWASAGKTASQVGFYWLLPEVLRGCQSYLLTARGDSQLQALQRGPWSPVLPSPLPFSPQTRKTCLTSLSPHFPLSVHLWENRPSQGRGEVTAAPTLMTSHPSTGRLGRDTLRHGSPAPMLAPPRWE